jgi:hypothetical protein
MSKQISKELAKLKDEWDEPAKTGKAKLEDGEYTAKLTSMELTMSAGNKLMCVSEFEIVEPEENEGSTIRKYDMMGKENIPYFKGYCEKLGMEWPDDPEDIEATIESFMEDFEEVCNITVSTKNDFTNVFLDVVGEGSDDDDDKKKSKKSKSKKKDDDDDDDDGAEKLADLKKTIKKNKLDVDIEDFEDDGVYDTDAIEKAVTKAMKKKKK